MDNQNSKVKSKEQLKQELQIYQPVLSKSMVEYLEQLIELDFSVVKKYISGAERQVLSKLEIYRDTEIYNIYHRAIQLLEQSEMEPSIYSMEKSLQASIRVEGHCIQLLKFDLPKAYTLEDCPQVGKIRLYQSLENEEMRKQEIDLLCTRLEILKNGVNPFTGYVYMDPKKYDNWNMENNRKIVKCESMLKKISNNVLTESDKKTNQYINTIHDLFMEDYGLTEADFEEIEDFQEERTNMQKVYVKSMSTLQIERKVNYL